VTYRSRTDPLTTQPPHLTKTINSQLLDRTGIGSGPPTSRAGKNCNLNKYEKNNNRVHYCFGFDVNTAKLSLKLANIVGEEYFYGSRPTGLLFCIAENRKSIGYKEVRNIPHTYPLLICTQSVGSYS